MPTALAAPTPSPPLLTAFPWLGATALRDAHGRIMTDIDSAPMSVRVARLVMQRCPGAPLNVLFPTIGPDVELLRLDWSARHRNVLRRHNLTHGQDLARMTAVGLEASWSVGPKSTETILARLAQTALETG